MTKLLAALGSVICLLASLAALPLLMARSHPTLGFVALIVLILAAAALFAVAVHDPKPATPRWGRGDSNK